jgi:hypothetical protein
MSQALHEIVGLSSAASSAVIADAADWYSEELFSLASGGDSNAQRVLVELQFAYLVWAYARPDPQSVTIHRHQAVA